ncbi:hypothetical protein ACWDUL_35880 [Nocardia niigatensis]|uniref:hypothetical protein n=1 Tax=Nocardia niigatensis TaxID=209249 RepID=UPI0002F1ABBA|nr:hypothetical protein [Nocardia niigatensis]
MDAVAVGVPEREHERPGIPVQEIADGAAQVGPGGVGGAAAPNSSAERGGGYGFRQSVSGGG